MTDPVPGGEWAGAAAFVASLGALITSFVKRGPKRDEFHRLGSKLVETTMRVAVVESKYGDIDRRLSRIEMKLDRVIDERSS